MRHCTTKLLEFTTLRDAVGIIAYAAAYAARLPSLVPTPSRGVVEDTRLEAKAKVRTKKNPRPRTAFPRTDTLEAKNRNARGQGPRTQAQVLSKKKKGLHKNFSGDQKKGPKTFFRRSSQKNVFQKFFRRSTKF